MPKSLLAAVTSALVTDLTIFALLRHHGVDLAGAHLLSFACAALTGTVIFSRLTPLLPLAIGASAGQWSLRFLMLWALAAFLRGGILISLLEIARSHELTALAASSLIGATLLFLGYGVWLRVTAAPFSFETWRTVVLMIVGYLVALRLAYIGVTDLIPDEAYYWQYAQHLDLSYLDHPPLVGWTIRLFTELLGDNELGVRLGALLSWLLTAGFMFALTHRLYGQRVALGVLLVLAGLPYFFALGALMYVDALLIACWAGFMYFLERALVANRRAAWWGVGTCMGVGMLAKYTMCLLGPAALLLMLLDRSTHHWFRRWEPYAALLVALLIFSPVLIWNAQHDWASFAFQTSRRLERSFQFSLHLALLHIVILITPLGLVAAGAGLLGNRFLREGNPRGNRLFLVLTLTPLLFWITFSLIRYPRFHWTGPLWLAALPAMASTLPPQFETSRFWRGLGRCWPPMIALLMLLYAGSLHLLALGLPGIPYPNNDHYYWTEAAQVVVDLEEKVTSRLGEPPIVVGMSKWSVASALAFYHPRGQRHGDPTHIASRHLFGRPAVMHEYWNTPETALNRPLLLIAMDYHELEDPLIAGQVSNLGPIQTRVVFREGKSVRHLYYRIADRYLGPPSAD